MGPRDDIAVDENFKVTNSCRTAADGRWFCRRVVEHQRISDFALETLYLSFIRICFYPSFNIFLEETPDQDHSEHICYCSFRGWRLSTFFWSAVSLLLLLDRDHNCYCVNCGLVLLLCSMCDCALTTWEMTSELYKKETRAVLSWKLFTAAQVIITVMTLYTRGHSY